jgi:hypothetical protein
VASTESLVANPLRGEVAVTFDDVTYIGKVTHDCIARIESRVGPVGRAQVRLLELEVGYTEACEIIEAVLAAGPHATFAPKGEELHALMTQVGLHSMLLIVSDVLQIIVEGFARHTEETPAETETAEDTTGKL